MAPIKTYTDPITDLPCFKCALTNAFIRKAFIFRNKSFISGLAALVYFTKQILNSKSKTAEKDKEGKLSTLFSDIEEKRPINESKIDMDFVHLIKDRYVLLGIEALSSNNDHDMVTPEEYNEEGEEEEEGEEKKSKAKKPKKPSADWIIYRIPQTGNITTEFVKTGESLHDHLPIGLELIEIVKQSHKTNRTTDVIVFLDPSSEDNEEECPDSTGENPFVKHYFSLERPEEWKDGHTAVVLSKFELSKLATQEKKLEQEAEQLEFEMEVAEDKEIPKEEKAPKAKRVKLTPEEKEAKAAAAIEAKQKKAAEREEAKAKKAAEKEAKLAEKEALKLQKQAEKEAKQKDVPEKKKRVRKSDSVSSIEEEKEESPRKSAVVEEEPERVVPVVSEKPKRKRSKKE